MTDDRRDAHRQYLDVVADPVEGLRLARLSAHELVNGQKRDPGPLQAAAAWAISSDVSIHESFGDRERRETVEILRTMLEEHVERLLCETRLLGDDDGDPEPAKAPTAQLAAYLCRLGDGGMERATELEAGKAPDPPDVRDPAQGHGRQWLWFVDLNGNGPPYLRHLAWALWCDVVRPRLFEAAAAGVSSEQGAEGLIAMTSPSTDFAPRTEHPGFEIVDRNGRPIGDLAPTEQVPQLPETLARKVLLLKKLPTQKLLRLLIDRAWRQYHIERCVDPDRIVILGGWSEVAHLAGVTSHGAAVEMHQAAETLRVARLDTPLGRGGFFSYWETYAAPGQKAKITFTLSGPLSPSYVIELKQQAKRGKNCWVVPVPRQLPPMHGGPRTHPAQAALQLVTMLEFRRRADEFADEGSIGIAPRRWTMMGRQAGIENKAKLLAVLETWQTGDSVRPPFLVQPDRGRWKLAPEYSREARSIREAGRRTLEGRQRREISKKRRR